MQRFWVHVSRSLIMKWNFWVLGFARIPPSAQCVRHKKISKTVLSYCFYIYTTILKSCFYCFLLILFQRETIVEIFYEKHLSQLIDVITSSCPSPTDGITQAVSNSESSDGGTGKQSSYKPEILLNICDLLCFCIVHHPYRIK